MFDILFYVFENCQQAELVQDEDGVAKKLASAGFEETDICEAMSWLAGVVRSPLREHACALESNPSTRIYAPKELAKLDADGRGFLLRLEQAGVLSPSVRELVLERVLATADGPLSLLQLKLIVLMVLWNRRTPASQLIAEDLLSTGAHRQPS